MEREDNRTETTDTGSSPINFVLNTIENPHAEKTNSSKKVDTDLLTPGNKRRIKRPAKKNKNSETSSKQESSLVPHKRHVDSEPEMSRIISVPTKHHICEPFVEVPNDQRPSELLEEEQHNDPNVEGHNSNCSEIISNVNINSSSSAITIIYKSYAEWRAATKEIMKPKNPQEEKPCISKEKPEEIPPTSTNSSLPNESFFVPDRFWEGHYIKGFFGPPTSSENLWNYESEGTSSKNILPDIADLLVPIPVMRTQMELLFPTDNHFYLPPGFSSDDMLPVAQYEIPENNQHRQ